MSLPHCDSLSVYLAHPTDEELQEQCRNNAVSWREPLTVEAYLRRERYLSQQDLTKDGGITFWVLVFDDEKTGKRLVLSGCETLRKRGLVSRNGGEGRDVVSHGVGGVFTPLEFRRRGYAARMLKELGEIIGQYQNDGMSCGFSILYSDIGKVSTYVWADRHYLGTYSIVETTNDVS